jgi:hypothetical protein
MTTTLVNIWAGSGAGKSTTAAHAFALMKQAGLSVELVREYVKGWAWQGRSIGEFDDVYITSKQLQAESILYGKVDYIITDSPIGLGAVYEEVYKPGELTMWRLTQALRQRQIRAGVRIVDCLLRRTKPFVQAGRYENETQARGVDQICERHLRTLCGFDPYAFHEVENAHDVLLAVDRARAVMAPAA